MNLADRIVKCGVGEKWDDSYLIDNLRPTKSADEFCEDGRVVLAMMEKMVARGLYVDIFNCWKHYADPNKESLAIAILTACCEAVERNNE